MEYQDLQEDLDSQDPLDRRVLLDLQEDQDQQDQLGPLELKQGLQGKQEPRDHPVIRVTRVTLACQVLQDPQGR